MRDEPKSQLGFPEKELLERFGDEDFLRELWLKCRSRLDGELQAFEGFPKPTTDENWQVLAQKLHQLRGLLANFLQGLPSVLALIHCEEQVAQRNHAEAKEAFGKFQEHLKGDRLALEEWLSSRGYPC